MPLERCQVKKRVFFSLLLTAISFAAGQDLPRKHQQMDSILDTLVGDGDFANLAAILSFRDPSILPVTATLFIPSDSDYDTVSSGHLIPFLLFPYHIVPHRLCFADLKNFPINTRFPTLLPGFSLLVTNNSRSNFSIDGVPITHPDLYQNVALSAHGVAALFDYTIFGNFDFQAVYGNSTTAVNAAAPHPEPHRWRKDGRRSGGDFVGHASRSGSHARNIFWFSRVLTLMGVLGLVPIEMGFS